MQEVLIADVADGSRGSTYAALTPFFVLGGLMVCNTCICGTRSAHSLLFSVAIAATTVLVALKVEVRARARPRRRGPARVVERVSLAALRFRTTSTGAGGWCCCPPRCRA